MEVTPIPTITPQLTMATHTKSLMDPEAIWVERCQSSKVETGVSVPLLLGLEGKPSLCPLEILNFKAGYFVYHVQLA
jgi:hypothetical protein